MQLFIFLSIRGFESIHKGKIVIYSLVNFQNILYMIVEASHDINGVSDWNSMSIIRASQRLPSDIRHWREYDFLNSDKLSEARVTAENCLLR